MTRAKACVGLRAVGRPKQNFHMFNANIKAIAQIYEISIDAIITTTNLEELRQVQGKDEVERRPVSRSAIKDRFYTASRRRKVVGLSAQGDNVANSSNADVQAEAWFEIMLESHRSALR